MLDKTPHHDDFIDVLLFRAFNISMVISLLIIHVKGYPKCYTVYLLIIYFALININIYIIFEIPQYGKKTYFAKFPITQSYRSRYASLIPLSTSKTTFHLAITTPNWVFYKHIIIPSCMSNASCLSLQINYTNIFTLCTISDAIFCRGIIRNEHIKYTGIYLSLIYTIS